jgi:hypothetical protein
MGGEAILRASTASGIILQFLCSLTTNEQVVFICLLVDLSLMPLLSTARNSHGELGTWAFGAAHWGMGRHGALYAVSSVHQSMAAPTHSAKVRL